MSFRLSRNVALNVANSLFFIGGSLVSVPIVIGRLGEGGYGVWTIGLTTIVYLATADGGLGPSVQRFTAVARGRGDDDLVGRLLWSALSAYAAIGLVAWALAVVLAAPLVRLFDVAPAMRSDATSMFRWIGATVLLTLLASALANVQQGLQRYPAFAAGSILGVIAYVAGIVVARHGPRPLTAFAACLLVQQAVVLGCRTVDLATLLARRPRLVSGPDRRALLGFSGRLQLVIFGGLLNSQTDKVVVGLVATPTAIGQVGLGAQVAEAGRLVTGAAMAPVVSRLSHAHGTGEALGPLYDRLQRLWLTTVGGGTLVAAACVPALLRGWIGAGHGTAALYGSILVLAYGTGMAVAVQAALLRAMGDLGLEFRYGFVVVGVNVVATIALGWVFGARGVVTATLAAHLVGVGWFRRRFSQRRVVEAESWPRPPWLLGAAACAAAAVVGAVASEVAVALPRYASLVVVAGLAAVTVVVLVAWANEAPLSPAGVRRLLA